MGWIVGALVVAGLWWRVELLVKQRLADAKALKERELALAESKQRVDPEQAELPRDLEAYCLIESEPWAQEDMKKVLRQLYHEHGHDWDKVRVRMRPLLERNLTINERGVLPS